MLESIGTIRYLDLLDIAVGGFLIWMAISLLRQSRARLALAGLAILLLVYLTARALSLQLTTWMLQGFFAVLVIVVVVVFQEDLRRFFEQIALGGFRRRASGFNPGLSDLLVKTAVKLSASKIGALIVVAGREPLERHTRGGIPLDSHPSEPLLLSIFDSSSPGHDGAVILNRGRLERFAAHLPLSQNERQIGSRGTRHAAALGLSEKADALCLVVSEEDGRISTALSGELRTVDGPQELIAVLRSFLKELTAEEERSRSWKTFGQRRIELPMALVLAAILWFVFIRNQNGGNP